MVRRLSGIASAVLFCILLAGLRAEADTFTNKKTGEIVQGRLLGTIRRDGKELLFVKTEDGKRLYLPKAEWNVRKDEAGEPERPDAPEEPRGIVYRGKRRSEEWVDEQYGAFRSKFTVVDGQLVDLTNPDRWQTRIGVGDACRIRGSIVKTIGRDDLLVRLHRHKLKLPSRFAGVFWQLKAPDVRSKAAQVIRLRGRLLSTYGGEVSMRVVAIGTGEVGGRQVVECRPYLRYQAKPITKDQFIGALKAGFPLSTWERCYVLKRYKQIVLDPRKRLDPRKKPKSGRASVYLVLSAKRTSQDEVYCQGWRRRVVE